MCMAHWRQWIHITLATFLYLFIQLSSVCRTTTERDPAVYFESATIVESLRGTMSFRSIERSIDPPLPRAMIAFRKLEREQLHTH